MKPKVLLYTLGPVDHLKPNCQAVMKAPRGFDDLAKRSQDFYNCISLFCDVVAWGCGRHNHRELRPEYNSEVLRSVISFEKSLETAKVNYDVIIQMGCHPNLVHKKPYFIFTDSGFSPCLDLELLDSETFPRQWIGINKEDKFHNLFENACGIMTMSPLTSYCLSKANSINEAKIACVGAPVFSEIHNITKMERKCKFKILFVGTNFELKGGYNLIKVYKDIKKKYPFVELDIVGVDRLLSDDNEDINFVPYTNDTRIIDKYYSQADLFVMPSFREPFGLVYIEAMLHKLPVICSSRSGVACLIKKTDSGKIVSPANEASIYNAIAYCIENPDYCLNASSHGYNFAINNFSYDVVGKRIYEVIASLLSQKTIKPDYYDYNIY